MNELLEYKEIFLNYPRKSIKEMERLLANNEKVPFNIRISFNPCSPSIL